MPRPNCDENTDADASPVSSQRAKSSHDLVKPPDNTSPDPGQGSNIPRFSCIEMNTANEIESEMRMKPGENNPGLNRLNLQSNPSPYRLR